MEGKKDGEKEKKPGEKKEGEKEKKAKKKWSMLDRRLHRAHQLTPLPKGKAKGGGTGTGTGSGRSAPNSAPHHRARTAGASAHSSGHSAGHCHSRERESEESVDQEQSRDGPGPDPSSKYHVDNQPWYFGYTPYNEIPYRFKDRGEFLVFRMMKPELDEHIFVLAVATANPPAKPRFCELLQTTEDAGFQLKEGDKAFDSVYGLVHFHVLRSKTSKAPAPGSNAIWIKKGIIRPTWHIHSRDISEGALLVMKSSGEIFRCSLTLHKKDAADENVDATLLKTKPDATIEDQAAIYHEARMLMAFDSPNIVRCFGIRTDKLPLALLLEPVDKTDMAEWLAVEAKERRLRREDKLRLSAELAAALVALEEKQMAHRAIRAAACMLGPAPAFTLKLADFGQARQLKAGPCIERATTKVVGGGVGWAAPETLQDGVYTTRTDLFSLGVAIWELWHAPAVPWADKASGDLDIRFKVLAGEQLEVTAPDIPDTLKRHILATWSPLPANRPPAFVILRSIKEASAA